MNILMVSEVSTTHVTSGSERVLRAQALGLAARGHEVRVVARARLEDGPAQIVDGGVREVRYGVNRRNAITFFLSSIRNAGRALASVTSEFLPHVVVVHQALPGMAVCRGWASRALVYVCLSLAHEEFESRNKPPPGVAGMARYRITSLARRWIERAAIRRAHRVIVLSDFMRRRVIACHGVRADRVRLIPGAVDADVFSPAADRPTIRSRLGLDKGDFVLFTVRDLEPRMGLDALIRAAVRLRAEIPCVRLLIGGSGPLREELDARVKSLGLDGCVRLLGFIPDPLLPEYYRAADLFVLPTTQLEGFGLVTVEALACGTPAFGTRIGATEEILGRLDAALLAPGTDPESLATGVAALYRRFQADPAWRTRLAAAGRALVLRDYTWQRHCEQVEGVLSEVCGGPPGSRQHG